MIWYDIWWYDMILYYIYTWLYIDKVMSCVIIYLYTVYIYIHDTLHCWCVQWSSWMVHPVLGWYIHAMYIYTYVQHMCKIYIYIHITYYRYIIIDCTKNVRVDLLQTQKAPQKRCRKVWNQDGSPMICSHIFPAVLFVVSMTGGCFIVWNIRLSILWLSMLRPFLNIMKPWLSHD